MLFTDVLKTVRHFSKKSILTPADVRAAESNIDESSLALELLSEEEKSRLRKHGVEEFTAIKLHLPELLQTDRHDSAVAALESYLQSFPRSTEGHYLLASVFEHAGAYNKALDAILVARYLSPTGEKIFVKQQSIENKALSEQMIPQALKVKCYTQSAEFFEKCSAPSTSALTQKMSEQSQKHMAIDFMLLSHLSEDISISGVSQYYTNSLATDNNSLTGFGNVHWSGQPPFRLQEQFPFQCLTTQALPLGSLVMAESPFAISPLLDMDNPKLFPTCFHCLRERPVIDKGFACPLFPKSCPFIFCSKECVLRNVNVHRQECQMITATLFPLAKETGFTPGFVLLVFRALIRAFIERSLRKPAAEELRFFFRLHSFTTDYEKQRPWVWNCIKTLCRGLCMIFPQEFRLFLTEVELQQFIAVIHSHAIPIVYEVPAAALQRAATTGALGLALSHNACSLGHSCIPTCSFYYTPQGRIQVTTLVNLERGQPLTISYIDDLFLPTSRRKNLDTSWKVLICSCKRCREVTEGSRFLRGQRCINCVRGIRNPVPNKILRSILNVQQKDPPTFHSSILRNIRSKRREFDKPGQDSDDQDKENTKEEMSVREKLLSATFEQFDLKDTPPPLTINSSATTKVKAEELDDAFERASWICNYCGILSPLDATKCDALEIQLNALLDEARELYSSQHILKARSILENISGKYGTLVHSNHYILYNTHVYLAGLWNRSSGGRNCPKALLYLRRALISANAVLPRFHAEKQHLFLMLANLSYSVSILQKTIARGLGQPGTSDPGTAGLEAVKGPATEENDDDTAAAVIRLNPLTPIEGCWAAVVNAWFTRGCGSAEWVSSLHRLRQMAAILNRHTPPLLYTPKLVNVERLLGTMRQLLQDPALTPQEIMKIVMNDHLLIVYLACARGDINTVLSLTGDGPMSQRELETPDLQTGLTALGCAAANSQLSVVQVLIEKMDADIFTANEWNITPLLAMAMAPLHISLVDQTTLRSRRRADATQAKICLIMVRRAQEMESDRLQQMRNMRLNIRTTPDNLEQDFPFLRTRLLTARSHSGLGLNSAAHYAAARGKPILTSQIIKRGLDVDFRNAEYATALHMAAISGHGAVVVELLKLNADVNALNYRGESALMLGFFGLHMKVIAILLQAQADINWIALQSGVSCFHCLVLGATITHKSAFYASDRNQVDPLLTALCGLDKGGLRDKLSDGPAGSGAKPPITYMTVPVFESMDETMFLFPTEILNRLEKMEKILVLAQKGLTNSLLHKRMKPSGFTAAELLKQRGEFIQERYEEAWGKSDLKLTSLSVEQRQQTIESWHEVFERIDKMVDVLTPSLHDDDDDDENDENEENEGGLEEATRSKAAAGGPHKVVGTKPGGVEVRPAEIAKLKGILKPVLKPDGMMKPKPKAIVTKPPGNVAGDLMKAEGNVKLAAPIAKKHLDKTPTKLTPKAVTKPAIKAAIIKPKIIAAKAPPVKKIIP